MKFYINRQEVELEKFQNAILAMRLEEESSDLGLLYLRAFIESTDKEVTERIKKVVAAFETNRLFKHTTMVVVNGVIFEIEKEQETEPKGE